MKSIKILGIAVATLGVAASVGGAIALYTKSASQAEFTIGAGTHTATDGNVAYKINGETNPTVAPTFWTAGNESTQGERFDTTHTQIKYEFTLGAVYDSGATPAYTVGNLAVNLTNVPTAYQGKLSVWASVEGYTASSLGKYFYEHALMQSDYAITSTATSMSINADVTVATAGVQKLVIYLKYSNVLTSDDELYDKDEASLGYNLSVTWGAPSNSFDGAYIVSDMTAFEEDDAYLMAPNIGVTGYSNSTHYQEDSEQHSGNTGSWQWMGAVTGVAKVEKVGLTEAKCRQNDTWSSGENTALTAGTTYDVYWSGNGSDAANFVARSAS